MWIKEKAGGGAEGHMRSPSLGYLSLMTTIVQRLCLLMLVYLRCFLLGREDSLMPIKWHMLLAAILIPGYERECNLGSSLKAKRTLGYGCSEAERPKGTGRWGSRTGGEGFCTNESKQTRIFWSVLPRLVPRAKYVCILFCFLIFLVLKNNPLLFVLFLKY